MTLYSFAQEKVSRRRQQLNLHHHLEKNLKGLEQTINIVNKSELKKNFIIYGPQLISCSNNSMLIRCLRQDASVEIECHDILMSAENAEELLVHRQSRSGDHPNASDQPFRHLHAIALQFAIL